MPEPSPPRRVVAPLVELERRFARPARGDLDALARRLDYRGDAPGPELWARAIAAGILPSSWADAPERGFRATAAELARFAPVLAPRSGPGAPSWVPVPATARAALLFASDPAGLAAAERLGRAVVDALVAWGAPAVAPSTPVIWRLAGNPVDQLDAGGPPLGRLREPLAQLQAALAGGGRIDEPAHPHRRFALVAELVHAAQRRERLRDAPVPAQARPLQPARTVTMPPELVGRSFASLPDPLAPWLALIELGYTLWAVANSPSGPVLELAAPFPPPRATTRRFAVRPWTPVEPSRAVCGPLRAVWSATLSQLRLACARGDVGTLRAELPRLAGDDEPDQPRLAHFAVYGGPEVLAALAETGRLELEARDPLGRTPLMLAASLPRHGPAGAASHEIDVPISDLVGARSCTWLLAAGADPDARDHAGQSALHYAAAARHLHAAAALLEPSVSGPPRRAAQVDAVDRLGRTPLHRALGAGVSTELVELLLAAGADPDHRDVHGWTALHYLATAVEHIRGGLGLARRLQAHGARPSRDLAGHSPAKLALLHGVAYQDHSAFDPRTPVAAGPAAGGRSTRLRARDVDPALIGELLVELVPEPLHEPAPVRRRGPSEAWSVWADWLQSRGDPRGELVAASLACARVGVRRRRKLEAALAAIEQRCAPALLASVWQADPFAPIRPTPLELHREHGFVTRARVSELRWRRHSGLVGQAALGHALVEAVHALLEHEPLLADLRVAGEDPYVWSLLLTGLAGLDPAAQVRRLVLERLPPGLPELPDLHLRLPGVRELWLIGAGKINRGLVRWPGLRALRLRHGDTSEWTQGGVAIELAMPDLEALDLALPVGMRTVPAEIHGCVATLAALGRLRHLWLQPLAPDFAEAILAGPILDRLRRLALTGVRGQSLAVLLRHAGKLGRLDALSIQITPLVAEQRANELADLRAELPRLAVRVG